MTGTGTADGVESGRHGNGHRYWTAEATREPAAAFASGPGVSAEVLPTPAADEQRASERGILS